jgi:hypothetical protein
MPPASRTRAAASSMLAAWTITLWVAGAVSRPAGRPTSSASARIAAKGSDRRTAFATLCLIFFIALSRSQSFQVKAPALTWVLMVMVASFRSRCDGN